MNHRAALAFAVLASWRALGLAQDAPPKPAAASPARAVAPPEFGSAITLLTLPVFVTDGQGRSVAGLKREDFEVLDEGRAMELVGFQEIDAPADGIPQRWMQLMRNSIASTIWRFSTTRMLHEYVERLYLPAAAADANVPETRGVAAATR